MYREGPMVPQPSLDRLRDVLPMSPFAWIEGEGVLAGGEGPERRVALDAEVRGLPLGVASERLAGAIVVVEACGRPDPDTARWLAGWVSAWGDLSDLLQPDEIADFPRFVVHGPALGDPLPGFTRVPLGRLATREAPPGPAAAPPEPLPFEHLHPDLQDRLGWLAALGVPVDGGELARLAGVTEDVLARERASLVRCGYLEPERGDWSLCPGAPVPEPLALARAEAVRPLLEARFAESAAPELAARLLDLDLRRGATDAARLAPAVLRHLLEAGRARAAAELARRVLAVGPAVPELLALASRALRESGDLAGASAWLASSPDDPRLALERARCALAAGDLPGALAILGALEGPEARLLEGSALLEAGRAREAARALGALGVVPAETPETVRAELDNLRGKLALHLGDRAAALASFDRLCLSPLPVMRARGFHNKALVRLAEGDRRRAIDLWQRAHAVASEAGQWYGAALSLYNVGVAYEYLGNYGLALRFLREALATFRAGGCRADVGLALTAVADVYLTLGRLRGARAILAAAARVAREHDHRLLALRVALREARLDLEDGEPGVALARLDALEASLAVLGAPSDRALALLARVEARLRQGGGAELKGPLAALHASARGALDGEVEGLLGLAGGLLRRDVGAAEAGFQAVERAGCPWVTFRAAGAVADLYRSLGDGIRHARWREVAERALERFRLRVPAEFSEGLERRPDVARHRLARAACLLADPRRLEARRGTLQRARYPWLVGQSPALLDALARIEEVALLDPAPVILRGPVGSGRTSLARALHAVSPRASAPFVVVQAAAVPTVQGLEARLTEAAGGTLCLAGGGALPEPLLELLERRSGAWRTSRDAGGPGRAEPRLVFVGTDEPGGLSTRPGWLEVRVPGLSERRADVPLLVAAFLAELNDEHGTQRSLPAPALAAPCGRIGGDDVRALRDEVHRLYWSLDPSVVRESARAASVPATFPIDLHQVKTDLEVRYIREALVKTDANIAAAARLLGMKRPRLSQKIRELDIDLDRLRRPS